MPKYQNQPAFPSALQMLHKAVHPAVWENIWFLALLAIVYPVYSAHLGFDSFRPYRYTVLGLMAMGYLYMAFKICFLDGNSWPQLIGIGACLLLIFAGCITSGIFSLLSTFLTVFSAKGISFRKICKGYFGFFLITLILNLLLVALGVLEDFSYERTEALGFGNIRHGLGFGHPNTLGLWCLLLVFSFILSCPKNRKIWHYLLLLAFTFGFYRLCDSKSFLLAALGVMVLCAVSGRFKKNLDQMPGLPAASTAAVLLMAAAFITASLIFTRDSALMKKISDLFSMRIEMSHFAFEAMGFSLLGSQESYIEPIDSLMAYGPIWLGVIPSLLYLGLAAFSTFRAGKHQQWDIVAISLAAVLYCTMESGLINPVHMALFAAAADLDFDM